MAVLKSRGAWLRLLAYALAFPIIWLSGPLASYIGTSLSGWPLLHPHLLGGFIISAPQKPFELLQYACAAATLAAYILITSRQVARTNGEDRRLFADVLSERFGLPLVVLAGVVVAATLCVLARGYILLPGLIVDCFVWLAVAVPPFLPISLHKAGESVGAGPGEGATAAAADEPVDGRERPGLKWAARVAAVLVVLVLGSAFVWALWPFLSGRLVVVNEFPDLREYVRIPYTNGALTEQNAFIAATGVGGLVPYDPARDQGRSPSLPSGTAVKLSMSPPLQRFLLTHPSQAIYDATRGSVVLIGSLAPSDVAALRACAVGAREKKRVDAFLPAAQRRLAFIQSYPAAKLAFVRQSTFVIWAQHQAGFFFHHHAAFLAPLTAIQNGDWLGRAPSAYGWLSTLLLGWAIRSAGGLDFSRYLTVSYAFYLVYGVLFLFAVWYVLRTWSARLLAILIASGAFYMMGFWSTYLAPGFNPLRHLLDVVCLVVFVKAMRAERPARWLALAFAVAVLQIAMSKEFGACLIAGALVATVAYVFWKPGRPKAQTLALWGVIAGALLASAIVAVAIPAAADSTQRYLVLGVWVDPGPAGMLVKLLLVLLGGCAIFEFSRSPDRTRFGFLMWLAYLVCLSLYVVWNPAPNHLWSLGTIIALACALALENVTSVTSSQLAAALRILAICAAILLVLAPGWKEYRLERSGYETYVGNHRVFDWKIGAGGLRSTADPQFFAHDVSMIRAAAPRRRVFMISQYQDVLLFLAGKDTGFPWTDLMMSLVTEKELSTAAAAIRRDRPAVLIVDRDIARSRVGDIVNGADPLIGYVQAGSLQRAGIVQNLDVLFNRVKGDYRLVKSGDLVDVYVRR